MSEILTYTTLPVASLTYNMKMNEGIEKQNKGFKEYNDTDVIRWLTHNITLEHNNTTYTDELVTLKQILNGEKKYNSVIHENNNLLLGMDVNLLFKTIPQIVKNPLIYYLYLNSFGFLHGKDQATLFNFFYGKQNSVNKCHNNDAANTLLNLKTGQKLTETMNTLNNSELSNIAITMGNYCTTTTPADEFWSVNKIETEEMQRVIEDAVKNNDLNLENLLHIISAYLMEPIHMVDKFILATRDFIELDVDIEDHNFLETMGNKAAQISTSRICTLRDELTKLLMPRFARLKDMDSIPALDEIIQVLHGGNICDIKAFYELVTFSDFTNIMDVSGILFKIKNMESTINCEQENSFKKWKLQWGKLICFLVYVELCRQLIPSCTHIEIGCVDDPTDSDIITNGHRKLPLRTIFYYQNNYYMRITNDYAIKCVCYKKLLHQFVTLTI